MKDVIVIGTGGHAKVIADIILSSGDNLIGFLTSDTEKEVFLGKPILGNDKDYEKFIDSYFIIAIGNANVRERISVEMKKAKWYTAIHPSAIISDIETQIDVGSVVMANAVINPCAKIGKHCIINTNATIEHDNIIDDFVHISVGAKIAGTVSIGYKTWIGIGATVSNGIKICENCMIGAGTVVVKNIEEAGTYVGVPAKKIK